MQVLLFFTLVAAAAVTGHPQSTAARISKRSAAEADQSDYSNVGLPGRSVCGLGRTSSRMIAGTLAALGEFPWDAGLEYRRKIEPFDDLGLLCGGSLINNRFVLSAAHCMLDREFALVSVRLGEWKTSSNPDCVELGVGASECADPVKIVGIEQIIVHPYYSTRTRSNDIGLLRLKDEVSFTEYIRPICMPPHNLPKTRSANPLTATGWDIDDNGKESDVKMKLSVSLVETEECNKIPSVEEMITDDQFCANGEKGKDSCVGAGGPVAIMYQDRPSEQPQWYQVGVGSWCSTGGVYTAVYTNVTRYINWIINEISDFSD